jgi:hypothetical protein
MNNLYIVLIISYFINGQTNNHLLRFNTLPKTPHLQAVFSLLKQILHTEGGPEGFHHPLNHQSGPDLH